MKDSTYYKLGLNILSLRKTYNKSQAEMACDLNISPTTICQYETGVQIPERNILLSIAKYFKITENQLIYGDFSGYKKVDFEKLTNKEFGSKVFKIMFPIISNEEALKNENFNKAYKLQVQIQNNILNNKNDYKNYDLVISLYKKSYEEGIVEGIANILWFIMLEGCIVNIINPTIMDYAEIEVEPSIKEIINEVFLNLQDENHTSNDYIKKRKEYDNLKQEYIRDENKKFFDNICILRKNQKYRDLAEYYIDWRYVFGLVDNDLSYELNNAIGSEMLLRHSYIGNKYAENFLNLY